MGNKEPKKRLVGPWRSLHVVIWMLGLYILLSRNWLIPGIFILLAISALYEGFLQKYAPHAFEEETPAEPPTPPASAVTPPAISVPPLASVASVAPAASATEHRAELLPYVCPNCGGPIRGHEVKWTGAQSADCPYCGTNLPMSQA